MHQSLDFSPIWRRLLALLGLAALAATLLAQPAAAAKRPTFGQLQAQVKRLTKQRNAARSSASMLRAQVFKLNSEKASVGKTLALVPILQGQVSTLTTDKTTLSNQVAALSGQVSTLSGQVSTLTAQRDQLLAGLPQAIAAVPLADFRRLVFDPARAAWPCDSVYVSDPFWSYSFDSPSC